MTKAEIIAGYKNWVALLEAHAADCELTLARMKAAAKEQAEIMADIQENQKLAWLQIAEADRMLKAIGEKLSDQTNRDDADWWKGGTDENETETDDEN